MNERERLIEILNGISCCYVPCDGDCGPCKNVELFDSDLETIADHLLASGFIEEKQNEAYDVGVDSALHHHFGLSWEDAAGLRKEVERIKDASRWIPVTERLPEEEEVVLTYRDSGCEVEELVSVSRKCWENDIFGYSPVTHWMPLPEPPKEE